MQFNEKNSDSFDGALSKNCFGPSSNDENNGNFKNKIKFYFNPPQLNSIMIISSFQYYI